MLVLYWRSVGTASKGVICSGTLRLEAQGAVRKNCAYLGNSVFWPFFHRFQPELRLFSNFLDFFFSLRYWFCFSSQLSRTVTRVIPCVCPQFQAVSVQKVQLRTSESTTNREILILVGDMLYLHEKGTLIPAEVSFFWKKFERIEKFKPQRKICEK